MSNACTCPVGYITIDRDINGTQLTDIRCQACPPNEYQGPNTTSIWECVACPFPAMVYNTQTTPWTCMCPSANWTSAANECVSVADQSQLANGYPLEYARQITYHSVLDINNQITTKSLSYSDLYNYYYYYAAIGCWKENDPTKCQILANLCVLQLYNEQSTVCQFFEYLVEDTGKPLANSYYNDKGWVDGLPWLYYYNSTS